MKELRMARKGLLGAFFIVPIVVFLFTSIASADQWAKTYGGGTSGDYANSIQQTSDGGFVLAGFTGSFGDPHGDAWIVKLDGYGNVQWQKTYSGTIGDYASSIQQTSDGGFVVAGFTGSFGAGSDDAWILKLDGYGNMQWQKTYGGTSYDDANSIQQTTDGGYVIAGDTESFGAGSSDAWVLKLDGYGNVQWQKTYGGTDRESAKFIQQTSDGGYIVAGFTESFAAVYIAGWILKLDGYGNVQWQKTYGGWSLTQWDFANSIQQTSDGGFVVTGPGEHRSFGGYPDNAWVLKLDGNGDVQWQKTYGGTSFDDAYSIQQTSDGGFVVVGYTDSSGGGYFAAWVLKLDGYGNVQWQKTYGGGTSQDYAKYVRQTLDGGYVIAGWTGSFGAGNGDAWILKLDGYGNIPYCPLIGTANATVSETSAIIDNPYIVIGIDTSLTPQTSYALILDTEAIETDACSHFEQVTLLSPNGGEAIPSGSTYAIRWGAPPEAVKFTLKYSINNGSTWKLIAKNITGTSYDWTVPIPNNNKTNCLVKVIGFNASGTKVGEDVSDSTFTIEVVKVSSPDGGEILTSGTSHTITWRTNGTIRPVAQARLSYSRNGGTSWTAIKTLSGNPGSYNWIVPNVSSSNCKVKVVLKDSGGVTVGSDVSDGVFTIQP